MPLERKRSEWGVGIRKKSNRGGFGWLGIGAAEVSPRAVGPRMSFVWFRFQDLAWIEQGCKRVERAASWLFTRQSLPVDLQRDTSSKHRWVTFPAYVHTQPCLDWARISSRRHSRADWFEPSHKLHCLPVLTLESKIAYFGLPIDTASICDFHCFHCLSERHVWTSHRHTLDL